MLSSSRSITKCPQIRLHIQCDEFCLTGSFTCFFFGSILISCQRKKYEPQTWPCEWAPTALFCMAIRPYRNVRLSLHIYSMSWISFHNYNSLQWLWLWTSCFYPFSVVSTRSQMTQSYGEASSASLVTSSFPFNVEFKMIWRSYSQSCLLIRFL